MPDTTWPPTFTLDQERILNLLTGDRFYSNPSAALREAVLNAIDAVQRRQIVQADLQPHITVTFNRTDLTMAVADDGTGMSQSEVTNLFAKVGASAATAETKKRSVGEFGIGVISYFMAADSFELQTNDGVGPSIGLLFDKGMLAGGVAREVDPRQVDTGTTVTLNARDTGVFDLLLTMFPYWCRDVEGLSGVLLPEGKPLEQGDAKRAQGAVDISHPEWVERSHLGPVADPTGWDAMTGLSTIAVLYRGVFVQEVQVRGVWGIQGAIDVDPKHFKPRLNREGFVGGEFQNEVESFLRQSHPAILHAMAGRLADAVTSGALTKWTEKRWASLWLSVPRSPDYAGAVAAWDAVFRAIPAFELAAGNQWEPATIERIKALPGELFLAPLADENTTDVIRAAVHFLRNTGRPVVRGIRKDRSWMQYAPVAYATTGDLISSVFAAELPPLVTIASRADQILAGIIRVAPLFTGPPPVDLVRLGNESAPALRLTSRLVINLDNPKGAAIVRDVLRDNRGPSSLIAITARHAHEQLSEVAAAVRQIPGGGEILSPVRRRFIGRQLS